jgi:hypothetical protein
LFNPLAIAGNEYLVNAGLILFACEGRMAFVGTRMAARFFFAAELLACFSRVFAVAGSMAGFLASMETTFQFTVTDYAATHIL